MSPHQRLYRLVLIPLLSLLLISCGTVSEASQLVVSTSTPVPTATPSPTLTPTSAPIPTTPTATPIQPPTGQVFHATALRSDPSTRPQDANRIALLCANATLAFLSEQESDGQQWYQVQVTNPGSCDSSQPATVGLTGWVLQSSAFGLTYPIEWYMRDTGQVIPTSIPTIPRPTSVPPTAYVPAIPITGGGRTGAICNDGTHSNATGRGACSHHGGVAQWLH